MKQKVKNPKKVLIIVLAAILVLVIGIVLFAGNFLFEFAVYPDASFTMNDLNSAGNATGLEAPAEEPQYTEAQQQWIDYSKEASQWYKNQGEEIFLERISDKGASRRRGVIFRQEGHRYAILFHGYAGNAAQMAAFAKVYWDSGYTCITPDALAHGGSDGKYIGMGWLERPDVLAWINWILEKDPAAEIVLHGISMGGATVMMAAGEALPSNVKCIVEDCGYSSVWDEFKLQLKYIFHMPAFPLLNSASFFCKIRAGYSFEEASAVNQLEKATVPMLFIHGEEDTFVPYEMLDVVYNACASAEKQKLSVPGAAHGASSSTDPDLYWTTVLDFVNKYVAPAN